MSSSPGSTSTNTIQNSDPWPGVQPYLRYGLGQGLQQYNRGPYGFVAGQAPAGASPYTLGGGSAGGPFTQGGFPGFDSSGQPISEIPSGPPGSVNGGYAGVIPGLFPGQGATPGSQQGTQGYIDPGAFLAGQSPETLQALQMQADIARDPNSLTGQAQRTLGATISGQYLDPTSNPIWDPMSRRLSDAYSQGTAAQTDAAAARANALGGSGYQQQTQQNARTFGDVMANMAGGLYNTERGYQMNALGMAPGMDIARAQQLGAVGAARDARSQAQLQAQQQAYMSPWSNLEQFRQLISGTGGGSQSGQSSSPYFTNPAGQAFGYGVGGLGLYNALTRGGSATGTGSTGAAMFGGMTLAQAIEAGMFAG